MTHQDKHHFFPLKILALIFCTVIFSNVARAERLPVKTYTVADGLLRDMVMRIRQDSRGFLWFCTAEGISRFDGERMTNFTVLDGLPHRFVYDFLETRGGTIYIATGKGLARLNPYGVSDSISNPKSRIPNQVNPLFTVLRPDNPRAEVIRVLFEDKNNQVWVGTSDGLYKLRETAGQLALESVFLNKPQSETLGVTAITEDRRGALWVGTGEGLFHLAPNGAVRNLTTADKLSNDNIVSLLEDRDGRIWIGFRDTGGLCILDAETVEVKKCYSEKDGLPANWIPDLRQTSDGKIWVATVGGLCLWQGEGGVSVCKTYATKNDLCRGTATLAEDKDENLWTGSECGAKKITRYGFTTYTEEDGLDYDWGNSIFENRDGELYVSTNFKGKRKISRFEGDKFSTLAPLLPDYVDYSGWGWQQTVWHDSRGAWWIPTGYGLFRSPDNTNFENLARAKLESVETSLKIEPSESRKQNLVQKYGAARVAEMKFYEIFRLFEDSRGDIWVATTGYELLRWERATRHWHNYTQQVGLSITRGISAFVEDRRGNIWIGTGSDAGIHAYEGLLIRYRDGQFRAFTHLEGAPRGWIRDLFLDSRGRLWIASTQDGLLRLDDTNADALNFARYMPSEGLTSMATASVTEDEFGRIYIGTWRGIDRLNPDTGQIENFTIYDGLPGSFVENSYRDRNNNLWFATNKGLARFQPEPRRERKPPVILITGLRVEGEPQAISILGEKEIPLLELNSNQNQISVDFLGLGASLGEKLNYEYRLGNSGEWTSTDERSLNFANLASGEYRFEARAQTADKIYSASPAVLSFRIAAPVWRQWWFLLLVSVVLAGLIYLFYRNRLRRLLEMERVRTRIATDLHDDIGANLTRIAILSEVAQQRFGHLSNGDGSDLLPSIAEISRESVSAMGDIVWAINPKKDSLEDLVRRMQKHTREVLEQRNIHLKFSAPVAVSDLKLDAELRRNIYLIFKETVNNVARHSEASLVRIDLEIAGSVFTLSIRDNGKGFDTATESDGNGLLSMRKRASDFGGQLDIDSSAGRGTRVVLRFSI